MPQETPKEQAEQDFLHKNSLRLAGALNLFGDVSLLVSGIKSKDSYKMAGGGLYTLGAVNLMGYGSVNKSYSMRNLSEHTAEFIKHAAGELPSDTALANILTQRNTGKWTDLSHLLHTQPAQNTMGLYTAGAAAMLGSGIGRYRSGEGAGALAYGISSLGVKAATLAIPEKSASEEKKPGIVGWIQEKPLRVFGYGSLASELFLGLASYQEFKKGRSNGGYFWTALSTGSYMASDVLMAISHKNPNNAEGKFTADETTQIVALAAEAIASTPKAKRIQLTNQVARFLAEQPEIQGDQNDIRQSLHKQMNDAAPDSWAERTGQDSEPHEAQR